MDMHRYAVGDRVEFKWQALGGPNPIYRWLEVEIYELRLMPSVQFYNPHPHYLVKIVKQPYEMWNELGHYGDPFLVDESYLRDIVGYSYNNDMRNFEQRCRDMEPIEIIEEHVQPFSTRTESLVCCQMARERANKRREIERLATYIDYMSSPFEDAAI